MEADSTVISDDEIGKSANKSVDEFEHINPAALVTQIESFKFRFASELGYCHNVIDVIKNYKGSNTSVVHLNFHFLNCFGKTEMHNE